MIDVRLMNDLKQHFPIRMAVHRYAKEKWQVQAHQIIDKQAIRRLADGLFINYKKSKNKFLHFRDGNVFYNSLRGDDLILLQSSCFRFQLNGIHEYIIGFRKS